MPRSTLKFLQLSDLHLDRSLSSGKLRLPYEKADQRLRELRDILGRAVDLAREEQVEVMLIPGDLWEEESLSPETVQYVIERLGALGIPVVISPGNHDYYSPASHYSSDIVQARFGRSWPSNVFIFRDYDLTTTLIPGLEDVQFTGVAFHSNQPVIIRKLAVRAEHRDGMLHIALIHGSRGDIPSGKMAAIPFNDAELLAQPFDWTALGHYHSSAYVRDDSGRVRGAYAGAAASLALEEYGKHGVLVGTVRMGGVAESDLRFFLLDKRQIHRLAVDVTGLSHIQMVESKIAESATAAGVTSEDMLLVELTGNYPQGSRISLSDEFLRGVAWHARVDASAVLPEWDLTFKDDLNPRTTEALFRARLHKMMNEATQRGDANESRRLQNALFYGLDSLHGRPITPRPS